MKSFGTRAQGARLERMKASLAWRDDDNGGGAFRNIHPIPAGLREVSAARPTLSEFICNAGDRLPGGPLPIDDPRAVWATPPDSGLRATWLGHSTVLIEIDGCRLLTDPVWGPRASPSRLAGPKRFHPVPVALKALPPIDAVMLSHDHYDHLDYPTVRELARHDVPFITSLGVGAHLEAFGVPASRITELDWWQSHDLPRHGVRITAAPAQHFSGRSLKDRNATLWSSLIVRSDRHAVFFSGDTGLTTQYGEIASRLGPFDLVMLEVGAYHPSWGDIHLGPRNALEAWRLIGSGLLLPVHWSTFSLALHDWDEPAETLLHHAPAMGVPLLMPRLGEAVEPEHGERREAWWRAVARRSSRRRRSMPLDEAPARPARELPVWPSD